MSMEEPAAPERAQSGTTGVAHGAALRSRVARHALTYGAGQALAAGLNGVGAIITARWLGPAGRGQLAVFTSASGIVCAAALLGLGPALTSLVADGSLARRAALRVAAIISLLGLVSGLVCGYAISASWGSSSVSRLAWSGLCGLAVVALQLNTTQQAVASACGRLPDAALNAVVSSGAMVVCYLAGSLSGTGAAAAVAIAAIAYVVAQGVGDAAGWKRTLLLGRDDESLRHRSVPWARLARLGAQGYPHTLLSQLSSRADILVLSWVAASSFVGVYSLGAAAASLALMVCQAFGSALMSTWRGAGEAVVRGRVRVALAAGLMLTAATAVATLGLSVVLTRWFLGPGFAAVPLCVAVLMPGVVIRSSAYVGYSVFVGHLGRPALSSVSTLVIVAVDLVLVVPLGTSLGAVGAAAASSISYVCGGLLTMVIIKRVTGASLHLADFGVAARAAMETIRRATRER